MRTQLLRSTIALAAPSVILSLALLSAAAVYGSSAYGADQLRTNEWRFLDPFYSESSEQNSGLKLQSSRLESKRIALSTENARDLPTVGLDASTGPAKVWPYKETNIKSKDAQTTWNTETKLTLKQNLYAGGVVSDGQEIAEAEYQIQTLAYQGAQAALWATLASDLLEITRLNSVLNEKIAMLQNAQEVQKIAIRKSQSGFLGRKELLESERETFRAENEKQNASSGLEDAVSSFNTKYQLKKNALQRAALANLQQHLHSAAGKGLLALNSAGYMAAITEASLDLRQKTLAERSAATALRQAEAQRFAPSLDLLAGLSATHQNTLQRPESVTRGDEAQDGNLRTFASLNFSMRLFDPVANSQKEAGSERLTAAKLEAGQSRFNLETFTKETSTKKASLEKSIENQKKLVALSEDLRLKNNRLFEAGETDILEVINSQKELSLQRQVLIELETQLFLLGIKSLLASEFGYTSAASSEVQKP